MQNNRRAKKSRRHKQKKTKEEFGCKYGCENKGDSLNEQRIMNSIIYEKKINVHVSWLDPKLFIPGNHYEKTKLGLKLPMVVLNNWIKGNAAKIARAKRWKHWYLDDNGKCV